MPKKFARELATAEPHQKQQIRARMAAEFLPQQNHTPSAYALW